MVANPTASAARQASQAPTISDPLSLMEALLAEFRTSAVSRDRVGGTPKAERDRIRASGLLKLMIPSKGGGLGASWTTAFELSRRLARVDASLAHVYSYHNLGVVLPTLFGNQEQRDHFELQTVRQGWWWGNALNPRDLRCQLVPEGNDFRLEGEKRFCSGSHDADILPVGAVDQASGDNIVVVVPSEREGLLPLEDWDAFGQRQTDSGSVRFNNVRVFRSEVLGRRCPGASPFQTIRACLTQLNLAHIFVGIAEGALEEARSFLQGNTPPDPGAHSRGNAPHLRQLFGELVLRLQAASALLDQASLLLDRAWARGSELTGEERGRCALSIAAAKVTASRGCEEITNRLFDLVGSRGVSSSLGLDRYWRNWRTLSLHDPDAHKVDALGAWGMNGQLPEPGFYI